MKKIYAALIAAGVLLLVICALLCCANEPQYLIDRSVQPDSALVNEALKRLSRAYPELIVVSSAGRSEAGADVPLVKLGKGEKKGCVIAGIHSREHITINFALLSIEEYCRAYYSSTGCLGKYNINELLNEYTLYILPMSNPDGTDICAGKALPRGMESVDVKAFKCNANNVNLNANFPFYWSGISDKSRMKGRAAASEEETKNIIRLCRNNDFEWLLDIHIAGNCLFWRDEANGRIDGDRQLAKTLCTECGYYLCPVTVGADKYGGGLENWFRHETGKRAICVELVKTNGGRRAVYEEDCYKSFDESVRWSKTKFTLAVAMSAKIPRSAHG